MQYMYVASCRFLFITAKRIDNRVGFVKSDNRVLQYSELHFVDKHLQKFANIAVHFLLVIRKL